MLRIEGIVTKALTIVPPADCPINVMLFSSPPKEEMFSFTHSNAQITSRTPLFPVKEVSSEEKIEKAKKCQDDN